MNNFQEIISEISFLEQEIKNIGELSVEQFARFMQKMRLDWNFHSNHIEGNSLTYGETKTLLLYGITAQGKTLKDHLEIQGHNEAIEYILDVIKGYISPRPITESFIRELHQLILKEPYTKNAITPDGKPTSKRIEIGRYKTQPNHVITPTGEKFYYATPEETPAKMNDLVQWLETETENGTNPLILAVGFHYKFVRIHPFDDGNGRMARLLMNFILMKYGFPPAIIHTEERKDYINALRETDQTDSYDAFAVYVGKSIINSLKLKLKALKNQSLDEEGDFDKKIALLKAQINPQQKAEVLNTPEVIENLFLNQILPQFQEKIINQTIKKLENLFLSISFGVTNKENDGFIIGNPIEHISLNILNIIETQKNFNLEYISNSHLTLEIDFSNFIDFSANIDLKVTIDFDFEDKRKYRITFQLELGKYRKIIEKPYSLSLSEQEWQELGDFLGNVILEETAKKLEKK